MSLSYRILLAHYPPALVALSSILQDLLDFLLYLELFILSFVKEKQGTIAEYVRKNLNQIRFLISENSSLITVNRKLLELCIFFSLLFQ